MKHQINLILKANRVYFLSCCCFLLIAGLILLYTTKTGNPGSIINFHSFGLNVFFVNYTFFGDGIFVFALCIFLFYRNQKKLAAYLLVAFLSSGLAIQLLKQMEHGPEMRIHFEASQYLFHYYDFGNSGINANGLPSGHTAFAFVLSTILAMHFRKNLWSILFLLAAILVGYSRIYLAGLSMTGVLEGVLIGTIAAVLSVVLLNSNITVGIPKKIKKLSQAWDDHFPGAAVS